MAPRRNALPTVDFESTGNRARAAGGGGNPGVGGFNNRTATDFAAGAAALTDMVSRIQLERDTVKAVGEESRITTETAAAQSKLNPLDPDYQKQVADLWAGAKKQIMESGISSPAVLDDISKRMDRHGASMQIAAIGEVKSATDKKAQLTYKDAMDAQNAKIRNDPGNANLYADEFKVDAERLKIGMDPIAFEALSRKAADEMAKAQVIGYAEKGNYGAARNALKAQAPHLSTDLATDLSRFIDGKESKARADGDRARTANAANVLLDIEDQFNGRKPIDPNTRERIDAMEKRGSISPEHKLVAVRTWNNENQRYVKEAKKDAKAADMLATGTLDGQENTDRALRTQFGNIPFGQIAMNGTPEQKAASIQLVVGVAGTTGGHLFSDMKNLISNADNITNPKQAATVAYAAEAMDELEARAPGKIAGVTLSDTGVVNRTRAEAKRLIADGVPKAEARLLAAQTQMPKDKITIQQEVDLKAGATEELKKFNPAKAALDATSSWNERNIPFMAPEASATMGAEYKRIFEQAYIDTRGDKDRAKALADERMKKDYGPTRVGVLDARQTEAAPGLGMDEFGVTPAYAGAVPTTGTGMAGDGKATVQKHPPERYLKQFFPQLSDDQAAKVIMAELDKFNARNNVGPAPSKDTSGRPVVYLAPDATTEADLRRDTTTTETGERRDRKISYEYRVLRGDIYEPVISATTGKPVRYYLPTTTDQLKDNPVWLEAEAARRNEVQRKIDLDIEVKRDRPDEAADERAKRMRDEGRKLKQRAEGGAWDGSVAGTVGEIGKTSNLDRLMEAISQGPKSKNVIIEGGGIFFNDPAFMQGGKAPPVGNVQPPEGFDLPSVEELRTVLKNTELNANARQIVKRALDAAEERRRKAKKD